MGNFAAHKTLHYDSPLFTETISFKATRYPGSELGSSDYRMVTSMCSAIAFTSEALS